MPGKQARVLCPVCQEPIPPDETECENCGAFVIDEAVVRLSRALGLDREKALKLFEAGFRHPAQLKDRDPNRVLEKGEVGLLFICTNCGGFVTGGDSKCPRCAAEFETEPEELPGEEDILDLVLCPVCGADNDPEFAECEVCGEPLKEGGTLPPEPASEVGESTARAVAATEEALGQVVDFLEDAEAPRPEPTRPSMKATPPPTQAAARPMMPSAPPAQTPVPTVMRPPPAPVALRPAPLPKVVPKPRVTAQVRPEPQVAPRSRTPTSRRLLGTAPSETPPAPAVPTKRVRTAPPMSARLTKIARKRPSPRISTEMAAGSVLAAALGLLLAGILGQPYVAAGIAFALLILSGEELIDLLRTRPGSLTGLDGVLLATGVFLGVSVPLLEFAPDATATGIGLALLSGVPLAWATSRLHAGPQRVLLAIVGALVLAANGLVMLLDFAFVGTSAWAAGIVAAVPWPLVLATTEIRRRKSTSILRRELVRAERDIARRNYERSLAEYDRAIAAVRPNVPGAEIPWYGKGATLILLGRYDEALHAIDTALDINPRNEVAWVNKGNALTKMARLVDALRCFNAAIKVNPSYEVAWNNKGNALARLGKYEEALQCYERALGIDGGYRGAWVNKGFVLTKLGRFDEAASCADEALRLDTRRAEPA